MRYWLILFLVAVGGVRDASAQRSPFIEDYLPIEEFEVLGEDQLPFVRCDETYLGSESRLNHIAHWIGEHPFIFEIHRQPNDQRCMILRHPFEAYLEGSEARTLMSASLHFSSSAEDRKRIRQLPPPVYDDSERDLSTDAYEEACLEPGLIVLPDLSDPRYEGGLERAEASEKAIREIREAKVRGDWETAERLSNERIEKTHQEDDAETVPETVCSNIQD